MLWLILTGGLGVVGYLYFSKKFSYFRNHGIPQEPGYFPFGSSNNWKIMSGKLAFNQMTDELYEKYKHVKCVGYYGNFGTPTLLVNDPELAKKIMIKDFDHFSDRRETRMDDEANKYFANMLVTLKGMLNIIIYIIFFLNFWLNKLLKKFHLSLDDSLVKCIIF